MRTVTTALDPCRAMIRRFPVETDRVRSILAILGRSVPAHTTVPWLVLWGPGAPDRQPVMREHLAAGGHVIALDLAYWARNEKFRVSIDAAHPQAWVLRHDWSASRLDADRIQPTALWNPDGPVLVADIGDKARVQYGAAFSIWQQRQITEAISRGRPVWYRPKRPRSVPMGTIPAPAGPIEQALRGVSLVITYHSNVAVDAIRAGIPVICADGAAAAVYGSTWPTAGMPQPISPDVRDRFLQNLAWFQWAPYEAAAMWTFLAELLR